MERIIELSKKMGHSHIGSSLTAWPIIEEIFAVKKPEEKFVLSNGHAGLALALKMGIPQVVEDNIHADRAWCDCSTGSLAHGLGIAVGMALADRKKDVYCMISDGECAEGSIWEALRIASEQKLTNLKVYVNANGWASYQAIDSDLLEKRLKAFFPVEFRRTKQEEPFTGLKGHYAKAT
jgi:transketolase